MLRAASRISELDVVSNWNMKPDFRGFSRVATFVYNASEKGEGMLLRFQSIEEGLDVNKDH